VWQHPHILLLDEVSTHLDFDTVRALKDALKLFDGSIIIVSHDRYLVKSVVEGEDDDDDSESDDDEEDFSTQVHRTSTIFALRNKKLERLEDGINGYELMLKKASKV
jgi:ATPase subunit of ABC transporter with duplicated ATPase domains